MKELASVIQPFIYLLISIIGWFIVNTLKNINVTLSELTKAFYKLQGEHEARSCERTHEQ